MKMTLCAGAGVAFCLVLLLLLVGQPRPLNASPAHHTGSGPDLDPDPDPDNDSEHIPGNSGNPGQDVHEVTEASSAAVPPLPGVPTTSRLPTSYNWKAGPWGSCYSKSGCGEGEQKRSVWCAHLDGRTSLEFLCELRHTPAKWRPCFQVCEEHRGKLSWRVGDWGPCVVPSEGDHRFRTNSNELKDQHAPHVTSPLSATSTISELGRCRLQPGVMARDVVCVYRKSNHSQVRVVSEDACDHFERKPRSRMSCRLSCPQDCVSTPLGPWMACEGCGLSNRTRTRQVLVAPQNGGRQCPVLQEMYPCSETVACLQSTNRIREYRLRIGPWSECLPQEHPLDDPFSQYGFRAVVGYRTRDILCKDDNGLPTDLSFCLGNESPSVPPKVEACVVPVDCVVSSWSEWEVVAEGCVAQTGAIRAEVRRRRRHILRPPVGEGSPCPHLEETHRLVDKDQLAPCTKYKWVPTEWSDCVLTELTMVRKVMCGGGVQNRNLTCLRSNDMVPVPLVYCAEPPPPVVQRCAVACRQDCIVSSWSAWGICQPFDCSDYFAHKTTGYRERTREVIVWPAAGGNECPTLRQVDACENPSCYQWKTSEFSQCMTLNKEIKCGLGKQSRTAVCISTHGTQVGDALCTLRVPEPQLSVPCYIPCPNDCVLSPWSEWSPCSHVCVDKSDEGYRFRNRTILAPAGGGGTPCPSADKLKETEMCNQHSCHGFGWKAMPWSQCVLSNPETEMCGPGEKTREVRCVRNDDRRYHEKRCNPLPKPAEKSPCKVPCLKDCVLSVFSDWTPCRDACDTLQRRQQQSKGHHQQQYNHQLQFQERRRYVMQWPEENRTPCSTALVEKRACPAPCNGSSCPQPCHTYSWAFSEWGICILPDNMECGTGYRTRGVSCVRSDGQEVEISYCLQGSKGTVSASWQLCRVACAGPCVFSKWSEWTECPPTCSGHQVRKRMLLEGSDEIPECVDSSKYPLEEQRSCPCNVHSAVAKGDFSDCLLGEMDEKVAVNGAEVRGRCGVGWKQRKVTCNDKNGNLADPFLCALTGYEEDSCMIQCPGDCKMTSWSDWSPCTAVCGAGTQHRTRRVEQFDFEGGRPCPAVDEQKKQIQVRLCEASCLQYQWVAYGWTQCELYVKDKSHGCGTGVQTRRVRCMRTDVPQQFEARDELCDPVMRPPDINYCHVPCSNDCVVSEWSEWTVCPHPCDRHRTRRRTRTVVRKPLAIGVSCPMLEEIEACELNKTCFHYNWNFTNSGRWTSCVIHDSAVCGEGVKRRGVVCQRSDGRTVEDKFCEQLGIHRPDDVEATCVIDCPVDCEVSEWSEWNADDCGRCGSTGVVVRMRHVTVPASEMGRPCPVDLVQRKPCLAHPCYDWSSSDWSECELEGGQCGHGTKRREVICRRTDGTAVDRRYCLEANTSVTLLPLLPLLEWRWIEKLLDIHEEERCFVPCPGDCVLTAWSDWSPCHRDCENGEQVGSQTRSRAILAFPTTHGEPCPDKLWETKPCFGGPCFTYDWRVKTSSESVECVRSDGLVVIGGCDGKARPCVPACQLAHSECSRQGVCICKHDYQPVFRALHTTTSLHNSATLTETAAINGVGGKSAAQLLRCVPTALINSSRDTNDMAANDNTRVIYYPKDGEASFWMYAMISVGSAFIIFVAVTVYLMCHSSVRHGGSPLRRHSLTMRRVASKDAVSVTKP